MKTRDVLAVAVVLVAAPFARPGMPVTVVADAPAAVNQGETMAQWAEQFEKWKAQIEQAKAVAAHAKALKEYAGDPAKAVAQLADLTEINGELQGMLGDNKSAKSMATTVSPDDLWSDVGSNVTVGDKTYPRDENFYAPDARRRGTLDGTRDLVDQSRNTEAQILAEANAALERLRSGEVTESDKQRAELEMLRAMLAQQVAANRAAAAKTDADIAKEREEADVDVAYRAVLENEGRAAAAARTQAASAARTADAASQAALAPVERTDTDWKTVYGVGK